MKALERTSFPEIAERISALYNEEDDAMLLGMLGQDYVIRHSGISLHGQSAPENHGEIILDYLVSRGVEFTMMPWRSIGDFMAEPAQDFRQQVELPLAQHVAELISRANSLLPHVDAKQVESIIGSDMAFTVRALPKVHLHVEMSQETEEFPAEVWVLFSNNAHMFLSVSSLQTLAEVFKDRMLSLLRIY